MLDETLKSESDAFHAACAREWLEMYAALDERASALYEAYETISHGAVSGIDYSRANVTVQACDDALCNAVSDAGRIWGEFCIAEAEREWRLRALLDSVLACADAESRPDYAEVAIARYVERRPWREVAGSIGASEATAHRTHRRMLAALWHHMPRDEREWYLERAL